MMWSRSILQRGEADSNWTLESGAGRGVLTERADSGYIDLNPSATGTPQYSNLIIVERSHLCISERDGWGHLYLYDASTGQLRTPSRVVIVGQGTSYTSMSEIADSSSSQARIDRLGDPAWRAFCTINLDGSGLQRAFRRSMATCTFRRRSPPAGIRMITCGLMPFTPRRVARTRDLP